MQEFFKSEATTALRRVYFVSVDTTALQTRISSADMGIGGAGTFTVKISKNGAAVATPAGSAITEVDATNFKGLHYLQLNAADLDTAGPLLVRIVSSGGTKVMEQREFECDVIEVDKHNAIRGMAGTALPNVAAAGAGGLFTRGSGAGQINQNANGQIDVRVVAGDFITKLDRIAGLMHENSLLDEITYGGSNLITLARLRVFADAAAKAAATPGAANNADSEVYRYTISAVDAGSGQFSSFGIVRTL